MRIQNDGNVGIGTTSPLSKLHVEGACVTGDTLLPIRRKKKRRKSQDISDENGDPDGQNSNFQNPNSNENFNIENSLKIRKLKIENYEYDHLLCRIDEILPGDEVLSLNEETGRVQWSRINNLMDMGVRDIFELTTKSGRVIRTTAKHPYLVQINQFSNSKIQ
ncbi:hypothetical protein A2875_01600 [Candidatus Gottesmanbacteria bacterium RIFCSPHIGHO2_01_FULL_46_14]|uniref:Hint domain-containing protein n=1 Tax=Candidatus Gottesmanbacteria bacterium RIFCSPHIGHO2_01_FULL_46_14 TaxID=1798380 RepID=A0A1F5ZM32_9BACT|nr:MAG: hypothetical protein A2875_01600 [Candidatus Gottesmanbacteria bacterium RIFCSPHIGHO2_01_FULL_46_14]